MAIFRQQQKETGTRLDFQRSKSASNIPAMKQQGRQLMVEDKLGSQIATSGQRHEMRAILRPVFAVLNNKTLSSTAPHFWVSALNWRNALNA